MKKIALIVSLAAIAATTACSHNIKSTDNARYKPAAGTNTAANETLRSYKYYNNSDYRPLPVNSLNNCTSWEVKNNRC